MSEGGGGQGDSNSENAMWLMGLAVVGYFVVTMFFGDQIFALWVKSRLPILHFMDKITFGKVDYFHHALYMAQSYQTGDWTAEASAKISRISGLVIGLPGLYFLTKRAIKAKKSNPSHAFKRTLKPKQFTNQEAEEWPWTKIVRPLDLVTMDVNDFSSPWASARNPIEFAQHHRLLDGHVLNKKAASALYASRMGPLWRGASKLKPHEKALFAIFIARMNKDKDGADAAVRKLADSIGEGNGTPDYSFVKPFLSKYYDTPPVRNLLSKHAYVYTVLLAALDEARAIGILPPNFFLWLRPKDRFLWYTLCPQGGDVSYSECSGPRAHFLWEKMAKTKIEYPCIEKAVDALDVAIRDYKFE